MQDVAREVEGERLLQSPDPCEVILVARLTNLLERRVGALDVSPVMLVVVQFHDFSRDMRLERAVVVLQVRKRVFRHVSLLSFRSRASLQESSQPSTRLADVRSGLPARNSAEVRSNFASTRRRGR